MENKVNLCQFVFCYYLNECLNGVNYLNLNQFLKINKNIPNKLSEISAIDKSKKSSNLKLIYFCKITL